MIEQEENNIGIRQHCMALSKSKGHRKQNLNIESVAKHVGQNNTSHIGYMPVKKNDMSLSINTSPNYFSGQCQL